MKERPILFSAPMVRAILAGTKSQTRRVMKPQPHDPAAGLYGEPAMIHGSGSYTQDHMLEEGFDGGTCPHGQPGDRLWVRENGWERPTRSLKQLRDGADTWAPYYFDADGISEQEADDLKAWGFKRRSSIFMPRWASRITLEISNVRVEHLQDVSRGDCMAEGCPFPNMAHSDDPRQWYAGLWDQINGPGSWDKNPWVWCIEFRVIASE